jgi:hypothetical protein
LFFVILSLHEKEAFYDKTCYLFINYDNPIGIAGECPSARYGMDEDIWRFRFRYGTFNKRSC